MDYAYYSYCINSVAINDNNEDILNINFGVGKAPLYIYRKDLYDFISAIIPEEERKLRNIINSDALETLIEKYGLRKVSNSILKGRVMILVTRFRSYLEYNNRAQNYIQYITSLNINGEMEKSFEYETKSPKFDALYLRKK